MWRVREMVGEDWRGWERRMERERRREGGEGDRGEEGEIVREGEVGSPAARGGNLNLHSS